MIRVLLLAAMSALMMSGCASSKFKERQAHRDKVAAQAGLYCEFISGDVFPDLDVELNVKMAQRCEADRPFSITNYKNSSDQNGVMYCCGTQRAPAASAAAQTRRRAVVKEAPAAAAPAVPTSTVNPAPAKASDDDVLSDDGN